ncbi:MAG: LytTR family DNA-binding domain-containing protein [Bacteroidota bacterium]
MDAYIPCHNCGGFYLPGKEKTYIAQPYEILKIVVIQNYCHFYFKKGTKVCAELSLKTANRLLDPEIFFKVNKSMMVNLEETCAICKQNFDFRMKLNNGEIVKLSRFNYLKLIYLKHIYPDLLKHLKC